MRIKLVDKTKQFFLNLLISYGFLFCVTVAIICAYRSKQGFEWLCIIPFFFGIYFYIFPGIIKYVDMSPGMLIICVVSFSRYVIGPLLTVLSGIYFISSSSVILEPIYFEKAIIITFYEMTCIMIAIFKFKSRRKCIDFNNNSNTEIVLKYKVPVLTIIIIVALFLLIANPSLLNNYNSFIVVKEITITKYGEYGKGIQPVLIEIARYILPLVFLSRFHRKYIITRKSRYIIFSIMPILLIMSFFIRSSRGSVLVPGITYLFLLTSLYREKRKSIFVSLSGFLLVVMVSMTLFKSFGLNASNSSISVISLEWLENFFQVYFAGIKNIAIAIKANETFGNNISIITFISELFRNFPGISGFTEGINTTTKYFNLIYYSGREITDQVIPTVGQGVMYLGYILSTSFSVCFVIISLKCDELYRSEKRVEYAFLYALIAVNFANNHVANIQLLAAFVSNWVLPLIIVFKLNEYFVKIFRIERNSKYAKSINNSTYI